LPPISASVEYAKLPIPIPLSVGGYVAIAGYKNSATLYGTQIAFGARAAYHFNFLANLDVYGAATFGYLIWNHTSANSKLDWSTFYYGACIGARYFFTNFLGAYLELGYSALSYVTAGVTFKF
jgi:hypothetical protein